MQLTNALKKVKLVQRTWLSLRTAQPSTAPYLQRGQLTSDASGEILLRPGFEVNLFLWLPL